MYTDMTVASYLRFVARIKGLRKAEIGEALDTAITRCGLTEVVNRLTGQLSKGFRQRVRAGPGDYSQPDRCWSWTSRPSDSTRSRSSRFDP